MLLGLWIIIAFIVYSARTRYAILVVGPNDENSIVTATITNDLSFRFRLSLPETLSGLLALFVCVQLRDVFSYAFEDVLNILGLSFIFKNVNEFFIPVRIDNRGRVYCISEYLNYQGIELAKSLLLFSKCEKIFKYDKKSIDYLKIFVAFVYLLSTDLTTINIKYITKKYITQQYLFCNR